MTRVALYTRVSTEEQAKEGYSLAAQVDRLRAYCDSQGWDIAGVYTDEGLSAKNMERPQLRALMRACAQNKFDVVLVYRLDRITRSVLNLHELLGLFQAHGVGFKSATEDFSTLTAQGRFLITLVGAMAQWERENLGERIRMGLHQKTRQGRWHSTTVPYGYRFVEGRLLIQEDEAELVRAMFAQYIGGMGVHRLMQWLRTQSEASWTHSRVYYALNNPIYAGLMAVGHRNAAHDYEVVEAANATPIISRETWEAVRAVAKRRDALPPRSGTGRYALVGLLCCGTCGSAMVGYTTAKASGYRYWGYKCLKSTHKLDCDNKMHQVAPLEETVVSELERIAKEKIAAANAPPIGEVDARKIARLEATLASGAARRRRWLDAYERGAIDADTLRDRLDQVTQEGSDAQAEIDAMRVVDIDEALYRRVVTDLRQAWAVADVPERRELARALVEKIFVYRDGSVQIHLSE